MHPIAVLIPPSAPQVGLETPPEIRTGVRFATVAVGGLTVAVGGLTVAVGGLTVAVGGGGE